MRTVCFPVDEGTLSVNKTKKVINNLIKALGIHIKRTK